MFYLSMHLARQALILPICIMSVASDMSKWRTVVSRRADEFYVQTSDLRGVTKNETEHGTMEKDTASLIRLNVDQICR